MPSQLWKLWTLPLLQMHMAVKRTSHTAVKRTSQLTDNWSGHYSRGLCSGQGNIAREQPHKYMDLLKQITLDTCTVT